MGSVLAALSTVEGRKKLTQKITAQHNRNHRRSKRNHEWTRMNTNWTVRFAARGSTGTDVDAGMPLLLCFLR